MPFIMFGNMDNNKAERTSARTLWTKDDAENLWAFSRWENRSISYKNKWGAQEHIQKIEFSKRNKSSKAQIGRTRTEIAEWISYQDDMEGKPNGKKTFRKTTAQIEEQYRRGCKYHVSTGLEGGCGRQG